MRIDGRKYDELRPVKMTVGFNRFAEGSVLIEMGNTMVLCNASVEERVPPHVQSGGWITAEYSMLPRANRERSKRDVSKLKLSPRSAEIQRLIGRSLRSAVDLEALGQRTITVDGGTRTASVTGGWLAAAIACKKLMQAGLVEEMPMKQPVAAVSAGIVQNVPMLDLCYEEDSSAMVDLNCVMSEDGLLIELQGTGEERPFTVEEQQELVRLCHKGIMELTKLQKQYLEDAE